MYKYSLVIQKYIQICGIQWENCQLTIDSAWDKWFAVWLLWFMLVLLAVVLIKIDFTFREGNKRVF